MSAEDQVSGKEKGVALLRRAAVMTAILVAALASLAPEAVLAGSETGRPAAGLERAAAPTAAEDEEKDAGRPPDLELLEFLGQWRTRTGVWFDPTDTPEQEAAMQEQGHDGK